MTLKYTPVVNSLKYKDICIGCSFAFYDILGTCENNKCKFHGKRLVLKKPINYLKII
jgi:hypothetical protein